MICVWQFEIMEVRPARRPFFCPDVSNRTTPVTAPTAFVRASGMYFLAGSMVAVEGRRFGKGGGIRIDANRSFPYAFRTELLQSI